MHWLWERKWIKAIREHGEKETEKWIDVWIVKVFEMRVGRTDKRIN